MSTDEALKIVLELAEHNVLGEFDVMNDEEQQAEQARQIKAVAIVRVAFRIN